MIRKGFFLRNSCLAEWTAPFLLVLFILSLAPVFPAPFFASNPERQSIAEQRNYIVTTPLTYGKQLQEKANTLVGNLTSLADDGQVHFHRGTALRSYRVFLRISSLLIHTILTSSDL